MKKIIAIATIALSVAIFAAVEEFRGVVIEEVGNSVYAKTIYRFTGETNGEIRIVHTETPDIKGPTNYLSVIVAALQSKKVTDEIIRLKH